MAPGSGALPGAVLISSDLKRKAGLGSAKRLDPAAYAPERQEAVYESMFDRAEAILGAGHSVILDATFLDPNMRTRAEAVAAQAYVPFLGVWFDAAADILEGRLKCRTGDASDADVTVLKTQLSADTGKNSWRRIDASITPPAIRNTVCDALVLALGRTDGGSIRREAMVGDTTEFVQH
ncbi:AAA family ATPase [Mameliella sp. AT18]|nr:AAA family ATPase [Mameliella sp. AT18]MDD9731298.1 AAA family ATPase [Mameliella sp. AT18]